MLRKIASIVLVAFIAFSACASGKKEAPKEVIPDNAPVYFEPVYFEPVVPEPVEEQNNGSADIYAQAPQNSYATNTTSAPLNGIYVGILEFGGDVTDITPEFVFLDPFGKQQLLNYIDNYHPLSGPGSAYYYAVHKALTNVEEYQRNAQLPQVAKTTMIAITDGLDTASTNQDLHSPRLLESPFLGNYNIKNLAQYHLYVTQLLDEKQVNFTSIEVNGVDTRTPSPQNASLANKSLTESIADIVNYSMGSIITGPTVAGPAATSRLPRTTLTLPSAVYPIGTQLRIVFDGLMAANSTKYIEGKVSISNNGGYSLTNVITSGIILNERSSEIRGDKSQLGITYKITVNDTINQSQVRQWYKQPPTSGRNTTDWIPDSEFGTITISEEGFADEGFARDGFANEGLTNDGYRKNSVIVYLILDGSPSLGDGKNVEQIRSLAKNVINQLYNAVSNPVSKLTIQPKPVQPPQSAVSQPVPIQPPIKQPPQVTAKPPVAPRHTPPVTRQQPTPAPSYTQDVPKYVQFVDAWISGPYNGGYWVQVGAFQNSENIRRVTSALQNRNYRVDTSLTIVQDGIFLRRVLVGGPYSRAGAENELRVIRETVLLLPS